MSLSSALFSGSIDVLREDVVAAFTQELLVLCVFLVSFVAWKRFGHRDPRFGGLKLPGREAGKPPVRKGVPQESGGDSTAAAGQRQLPASADASEMPAMRAAEQQMLKHLEQREFTRALNLYRTLERSTRDQSFSEELYSAFIQSAIRVGKIDVVDRMLRAMRRGRVTPALGFWQTTLKLLSSRKHYSTCLSVHSLFGKQVPNDKVVYSCLINAALEVGAPDSAATMLKRYAEADIDPKDHVLFFRTYVALGDVEAAEVIFRKLGDQVTTLMLNLLLLTCVNVKQPERGRDFLFEAHELEKNVPERIVDVVSYNTVIKGFAQAPAMPSQCFKCLREMNRRGIEPDDITFSSLLDVCIADNDMNVAHEIVGFLMSSDRFMDTMMATLFIKGFVRANCLPKAMELYEEMKRREGARPDMITYSVLIKALVNQHDLECALRLVEDMSVAGHSPDDIIFTHLLEGCRHAGNLALGKKLLERMFAAGVKPSEFTLVTMLKLHGRCGAHVEAYNLVEDWEGQHGFKPSVIHYTCLMSGCLRTKSYDQAWEAYDLMCRNGVAPDETTISTILPGMVAAQQWNRVLMLAKQALKAPAPINIPPETLNSALSQMLAAGGLWRELEHLQSLMRGAGVPITASNAKRLI